MNKFSKKTAFGITTAAASIALVAGFAAPAMASTSHDTSFKDGSSHSSSTVTKGQLDALRSVTTGVTGGDVSTWTPLVVSPSVGVGDVASGDAIGSGNSIPVASGNDTAVGNNVANNDGNVTGNSITSTVKDLVNTSTKDLGTVTGNSASGSASSSASDIIGNITGELGLGTILGGR